MLWGSQPLVPPRPPPFSPGAGRGRTRDATAAMPVRQTANADSVLLGKNMYSLNPVFPGHGRPDRDRD
jgi:hypothetical protein